MRTKILAGILCAGLLIPGAAGANWLTDMIHPDDSPDENTPAGRYLAARPPKPDVPGDWVEEPYTEYGEYYPGYPGQSCFFRPWEEEKILMQPAELRMNYGKFKAGFGRPVYFPGDALPAEWTPTREERAADFDVRPHRPEECADFADWERAAHRHLAEWETLRRDRYGNWQVVDTSTDYGWLGGASEAEGRQRMTSLTAALVLMGEAEITLGNALGRDTSDVLAAVNLVKRHPSQVGMTNLSNAIRSNAYTSEEFVAAANGAAEQRAALREALELADRNKHASNKILTMAGLDVGWNIGNVVYALIHGDYERALGHFLLAREKLLGAGDLVKEIKRAYKDYTEASRAAHDLLEPQEIKEDSGEVEKIVEKAKDGGLDF